MALSIHTYIPQNSHFFTEETSLVDSKNWIIVQKGQSTEQNHIYFMQSKEKIWEKE